MFLRPQLRATVSSQLFINVVKLGKQVALVKSAIAAFTWLVA